MALRYWKRMRQQAALHVDDPRPDHENPWQAGVAPTLGQLGSTYDLSRDDRAAARYAAWAERLKRPASERATTDAPADTSGYWSPEALFEESRRVAHEEGVERKNPWVVRELLQALDLAEGATRAEISSAYRRLAKQHHPDRFMLADPETRAFHEAEMRRVIDAYEALCRVVA